MQTFGDRLRQWAKAGFGSLEACAEAVGINYNQLNKYINGFSKPALEQMERFALAGLNAHWALTGKGPMIWTEEMSAAGEALNQKRALLDQLSAIARRARAVSTDLDALLPAESVAIPSIAARGGASIGTNLPPEES